MDHETSFYTENVVSNCKKNVQTRISLYSKPARLLFGHSPLLWLVELYYNLIEKVCITQVGL